MDRSLRIAGAMGRGTRRVIGAIVYVAIFATVYMTLRTTALVFTDFFFNALDPERFVGGLLLYGVPLIGGMVSAGVLTDRLSRWVARQ